MKQAEEQIVDDIQRLIEMTGPPLFIQEQIAALPKTMTVSKQEPQRYLNRQERRALAAKQRRQL